MVVRLTSATQQSESAVNDDPKPTTDTARRLDRIEAKYDDLSGRVDGLAGTVERVELNQKHAEELNRLRFDALDAAQKATHEDLKQFMRRIEGIITGEVQLPSAVEGKALVDDYKRWRGGVDTTLTQTRLLGRIAVILATSGVVSGAIAAWVAIHT